MLGKSGNAVPSESPWEMKSTQVRQFYYNSVDMQGGYYSRYCVEPSARGPLIQNMAMLNRLHMRAYKLHDRWYLDQSAIVWKQPR
jgi:hypothetical protein